MTESEQSKQSLWDGRKDLRTVRSKKVMTKFSCSARFIYPFFDATGGYLAHQRGRHLVPFLLQKAEAYPVASLNTMDGCCLGNIFTMVIYLHLYWQSFYYIPRVKSRHNVRIFLSCFGCERVATGTIPSRFRECASGEAVELTFCWQEAGPLVCPPRGQRGKPSLPISISLAVSPAFALTLSLHRVRL